MSYSTTNTQQSATFCIQIRFSRINEKIHSKMECSAWRLKHLISRMQKRRRNLVKSVSIIVWRTMGMNTWYWTTSWAHSNGTTACFQHRSSDIVRKRGRHHVASRSIHGIACNGKCATCLYLSNLPPFFSYSVSFHSLRAYFLFLTYSVVL